VAAGHAHEHVLEIGEGLDVVELGGCYEGADGRPAVGAAVRSGKKVVLAAEGNRPFILPMSGRKWKFITGGIRILAARSAFAVWSNGRPAYS
jgi:hypothetical protein